MSQSSVESLVKSQVGTVFAGYYLFGRGVRKDRPKSNRYNPRTTHPSPQNVRFDTTLWCFPGSLTRQRLRAADTGKKGFNMRLKSCACRKKGMIHCFMHLQRVWLLVLSVARAASEYKGFSNTIERPTW